MRTFKTAVFVASAATDNTVIAAKAGTRFRVKGLEMFPTTGTAVTASFKTESGNQLFPTGSTKLTLDMTGAAGLTGVSLPERERGYQGWFETATANKALQLTLSGTQPVTGIVIYEEIDA